MMDDRTWADNKLLREMAIAEENERKAVTTAPQFGEPWTLKADSPARFIIENNNKNQVLVSNEYYDDKGWIENADEAPDLHEAQRIVACVNAMAGIPDPQAFVREVRELMERCWPVIKKDHDMHINSILKCDKCGKTHKRDPFYDCTLMEKLSAMLARLDAGRGRE